MTAGGTKEIGSALTRICLRHRSVEARLKTFTSSLMDCLVSPLQDRLDEWRKTTVLLDKDHAKEIKRLKQELKKRHPFELSGLTGTLKLQKRLGGSSFASGSGLSGVFSKSMESMEGSEKLFLLEEMEKKSLRRVLIEERSRFCLFVNFLRPVVDEELAMIQEISHLQEIMEHLSKLTADPYILPASSEAVIADLKLSSREAFKSQSQLNLRHTPPSSPSSFASSRKSSMCSISSFNSNSSEGSHSPAHQRHQRHHRKPMQMFDSRHIESLISYHPQTSSSSPSETQPPLHDPPKLGVSAAPPVIPPRNSFVTGSSLEISDACVSQNPKDSLIYASSGLLSRSSSRSGSRPPPPPPARRTSSISDPEAITLATLRVTGCSTYEEVKTLRKRVGSEANLYSSFQALTDQPIYSNFATASCTTPSSPARTAGVLASDARPCGVEAALEPSMDHQTGGEAGKEESLPPPPPEAFEAPVAAAPSGPRSSTGHRMAYNRITNVHREFLQTLNDKLANSPQQRLSPRLTKRRSLSVGEHDWDSDSGIIPGSTSSCSATSSINSNNSAHTLSLQQSLLRLMSGGTSRPSSVASPLFSRFRLTNQPHVPRVKGDAPVASQSEEQEGGYQRSQGSASSSRSGSWPSSEAAVAVASLTPRSVSLHSSSPQQPPELH